MYMYAYMQKKNGAEKKNAPVQQFKLNASDVMSVLPYVICFYVCVCVKLK